MSPAEVSQKQSRPPFIRPPWLGIRDNRHANASPSIYKATFSYLLTLVLSISLIFDAIFQSVFMVVEIIPQKHFALYRITASDIKKGGGYGKKSSQ